MKTHSILLGVVSILASAVASAALLVLAFPPYDYWFLAWVALVPMFLPLALPTQRPRRRPRRQRIDFCPLYGRSSVAGIPARSHVSSLAERPTFHQFSFLTHRRCS